MLNMFFSRVSYRRFSKAMNGWTVVTSERVYCSDEDLQAFTGRMRSEVRVRLFDGRVLEIHVATAEEIDRLGSPRQKAAVVAHFHAWYRGFLRRLDVY